MTIAKYLKSKEFSKNYACWDYATKIVDENGKDFGETIDLGDDEVWEDFINNHEVIKVEMKWELGCDNESYAYAEITTRA